MTTNNWQPGDPEQGEGRRLARVVPPKEDTITLVATFDYEGYDAYLARQHQQWPRGLSFQQFQDRTHVPVPPAIECRGCTSILDRHLPFVKKELAQPTQSFAYQFARALMKG